MKKIASAKKKRIDFPKGSKEKILEDNIISAMEEGFSNLSQIMIQGFSDLLSAINNLNSSKTNFGKDKNENLNLTHSLSKSLTESSKKIQIPTRPQTVIPII